MRDWVKLLRAASYRGVPFYVESDTHDGGKRLGLHELAGGYTAYVEEMGARAERVSVTAYLLGDVADLQGAALRAACQMPGPGLLCLPVDLPRMAYVEEFSRMRERDRMGYIAFGLTAVPAGAGAVAALGLGNLAAAFQSGVSKAAASFAGLF
ncbi:hypothetical protein BJF92_12205 [Rhizobium rhizosphaerae]|uniref:DNA circulation N-terminal domain-containing protein n=1 Tax=Xaviernesmea rhizosphaerae TaxID=1672749 RepID=A0A1Q9AN27_9HYPH|nr:DNA circularization N-terminal domain-containing protein [Xaviernesmea rhizosphaerae]OLP56827.1 hypothetical protein BJF92_12205 [Xaviernesmea rhizosphaerae]